MHDFEKLGVFYLGAAYDLAAKKRSDRLLLYNSKDLVTHAVCVGMTGSGKTGLCLGLLEEAAIDHIPAIIIDPKGDLPNLLLTFPDLTAADFRPWINEDEARRKNLDPDAFAAQQAELWRAGLAGWGQDGNRIRRLRESADFVIYTPGSSAGLPVSILKSFARPDQAILDDGELLRERIGTTVTSLLGLLGIDSDPIQSREHILLSNILSSAWQAGRDMDLAGLVSQIQQPPMHKVGVMDLESFYPSKDRFALAMRLNNLLAAPGFAAWMEGEALDIQSILYSSSGKPRHAIFSIAHLGDAERMFFVSLLLNQVLGWVRAQSGTTSLRALLYMDEIFGYFPPTANPPSKQPLLTLLKQARAFGLGVMLATQNPVDLDYKGLANCGTWFIGRLQTDRDKQRVLDGLEGAAAGAAGRFNRSAMEQTLAGLGNRVFLMNNVHEDGPVTFETRWCMCYLRGPMTRAQIKQLMEPLRNRPVVASAEPRTPPSPAAPQKPVPASASSPTADPASTPQRTTPSPSSETSRPVLPPQVPQLFLPIRQAGPAGAELQYLPMLLGIAQVYFSDSRAGVTADTRLAALTPFVATAVTIDFDDARIVDVDEADLEQSPVDGASFAPVPSPAANPKNYEAWKKLFADWIFRTQSLQLLSNPSMKLTSRLGETERDFRARLAHRARELRDDAIEKIQQRFSSKYATLNERIRRAELAVERERAQASASTFGTMVDVGASILGSLLGRRTLSRTGLSRAAGSARKVSRALEQRQDVDRAEANVAAARAELQRIEEQFAAESARAAAEIDRMLNDVQTISIRPKKTDITVRLLALAWVPQWQPANNAAQPAWPFER
ncbi:MAG: hypothetical protein RMJ35_02595 [Phycisphaerales bacterium]|nr:hypothetical protein [Phycisphaerales bacterium]